MLKLEQLIEACGDEFVELGLLTSKSLNYRWYVSFFRIEYDDYDRFYGSTPTDAVQKLYDYLVENKLI